MVNVLEAVCSTYFKLCKNKTINLDCLNSSLDEIEKVIARVCGSKLTLSECTELHESSKQLILNFVQNANVFFQVAENETNEELKSLFLILGHNDIHFAHLLELKFGTISISV